MFALLFALYNTKLFKGAKSGGHSFFSQPRRLFKVLGAELARKTWRHKKLGTRVFAVKSDNFDKLFGYLIDLCRLYFSLGAIPIK